MCQKAGVYGVITFGIGMTLRDGDRPYFYQKLDEHFPGLKERYQSTYGNAYELPAPHERELMSLFVNECQKAGMEYRPQVLFDYLQKFEEKGCGEQMSLEDFWQEKN